MYKYLLSDVMDVFSRITDEEIEAIDPVLKVVRHAYRLLDQYGYSNEEYVDVETGEIVDIEVDDIEDAECYRYLETEEVGTIDPSCSFCFDGLPFDQEMRPVLEPGYSVLHLFELDNDGDPQEVEQISFRQETHPLGAAILRGYGLELVTDPVAIEVIGRGLPVLEQRLWYDLLNNKHSHLHRYPESEMMNGLADLLESAVDE